jgi:hypothetical protein
MKQEEITRAATLIAAINKADTSEYFGRHAFKHPLGIRDWSGKLEFIGQLSGTTHNTMNLRSQIAADKNAGGEFKALNVGIARILCARRIRQLTADVMLLKDWGVDVSDSPYAAPPPDGLFEATALLESVIALGNRQL